MLALLAGLVLASPAAAQEQEAPDDSSKTIVVTGSRIARGQEAPNPITVLNEQEIQNLGLVNAADIVEQLPQNSAFTSTTNVGLGNFNIGASLANLRGLNPFFGTRTLVLVDTRRHVPTTNGGAVDLNVVPSMLIKSVETVTGGASAAYGSDAVAGVINVLIDTKLEGIKAQADYGTSFEGDGSDYHLSGAYGTRFDGGRGSFVFGAEYANSKEIGGCGAVRDWCAESYGVFTNADFATNGQPHYIVGPGARTYNSHNGLFPFANLQFNDDGTALVPFVPGQYANPLAFGGAQMQGGADEAQDQYRYLTLRPAVERYALFGHLEYDLSDAVTVYGQLSYAHRGAQNRQQNSGGSLFFNAIMPDNAYLPASAAPLFAFGPQPFSSNGASLPDRINDTKADVYRGVLGLTGDLGGGWDWDVYYTYGRNKITQRVNNLKVLNFFSFALDAVDNPATAAFDPVCRATLPGPFFNPAADGCVPLNLFGTGNYDQAAFDYAYRDLHQNELYQQHVLSASFMGRLHDGWGAGPIGIAGGVEYRHESIDNDHDIDQQPWYSNFELTYGNDFAGKLDNYEGFVEINVPLIADKPFFESAELNGAIRQTHIRTENVLAGGAISSDFTSWKINATWDIADWIRLRATRSRDVRAPGFYELFSQNVVIGGFFGSIVNPWVGPPNQAITATMGGASSEIGPEKADTWTLGGVLQGRGALSGAYASIDWYEIKLDGPISTLGSVQAVANACFNEGNFCDFITGTGALPGGGYSTITAVDVPYMNLGAYVTRGLDIEAGYSFALGDQDRLSFRAIGSYMYDMLINNGSGSPTRDYAGISGPTSSFGYFNTSPKWQANAFATYSGERFTGTIQARYIGSGKFALLDPNSGLPYIAPGDDGYASTLPNSISDNHVDSRVYFNLHASYRIPLGVEQHVELFGSVNNLFDTKPPVAPGGNGYPTNPVFFDTIGRTGQIGVRIRY